MKVLVYIKDPDAFSEGVFDAVDESLALTPGLSERERELLKEPRTEMAHEVMSRWVEYGEYVAIEFDIKERTAVVLTRAEYETRCKEGAA